jgi:branched-chain amino acid transport system substrate-binding protein
VGDVEISGTRVALLIGCSDHDDPGFERLTAPARDLDGLRRVLVDSAIGNFTFHQLLNESSALISEKIEEFFANRMPDDLLLLYFSCHGVLDAKRRLHFVAANTKKDLIGSTGISAQWVKQQMDHSRSQRIVWLIDCCYSGAFSTKGPKPRDVDAEEIIEQQLGGDGRIVITASGKTEYSYDSEFTDAVVRGLETGAADLDGDGQVEVSELYRYVHDQVRQNTSGQTPTMSADGIRGRLYLAKNPHAPLPLPVELEQVVTSKTVWKRRWAVDGLQRLLSGDHPGGQKLTARQALVRLQDKDTDDGVRAAAIVALKELSWPHDCTDHGHRDRRWWDRVWVAVGIVAILIFLPPMASLPLMSKASTGQTIPCSPKTRTSDGVLSLGTLLPITGPARYRSPALEASVQLAMSDIKQAGGIPGGPHTRGIAIGLDIGNQRDEGDALTNDVVRQSVETLGGNGVDVIIGPVTSAAALKAIDKVVTCEGMIMFSPANSATVFTTYPDRGFYFRTAPTAEMEGSVLGKLVVDDGNKTVVIMARDDPYGNSLRDEATKVIDKNGGQVIDSFPFDPNAPDFDREIRRVKGRNPDAIVLIGFIESSRILTTMIKEGLGPRKKRVYGSNANMNNTLASQVVPQNPGVLEGMKGPLIDEGDETFTKKLKEVNPTIRDPAYSAQAYDAVVITALAAAVAGTDEPRAVAREINGVTKDGEKCTTFAACMVLVKEGKNIDYDGSSGTLEFTAAGEPCSSTYVISEFQADGTVKPLKKVPVTSC